MALETERTFNDYQQQYERQTPSLDDPNATLLRVIGRLKPGASLSQTNAGLRVLVPQIYEALSQGSPSNDVGPPMHRTMVARSMNGSAENWLQDMDPILLLMMMAALVLIIACANLGNLLLARATKRHGEIATRLALGATRWRLVRQLLTESALLSVVGAALGILVAQWGSRILLWALSFADDPLVLDLSWDAKLVAFAVGITLSCALLFGLAPAISSTRISLYSAMNNGMTTGKRSNRFMNSGLIVVQVALSVTLLVSAGLLARTLQAFLTADLGYDPKGVLVAHATFQDLGESPQRTAMLGQELLAAFRSLPGVASASWSRTASKATPPKLTVLGPGGTERRFHAYLVFVSSDFFRTRRTPILAGREFRDSDTDTSLPVAVLSKDLARTLTGAVNPVRLRFRENDIGDKGQDYPVEVVGVAGDIQYRRPDYGPLPILYRPASQCGDSCSGIGNYAIRVAGSFAGMTKRSENAAASIDPHIVLKCDPLSNGMNNVLHRNRAMVLIASAFGLFVTLLAMIGIYGVTSYAASQRTREIGIRMALGAQSGNVLQMIIGETIVTVFAGVAVGIIFAYAAAQAIRGML